LKADTIDTESLIWLSPEWNRLEIKYATVLSNYVRSMKDNPTAMRWTEGYDLIPAGIGGSVKLMR
jgi:hypothetical protein